MEQGLQEHPHLRRKRLPSYSPQLNVIERFWRVLRRRARHNRLFATMAALRTTLRNNLCYFQTMRQKVLSLIESPRKAKKEAHRDREEPHDLPPPTPPGIGVPTVAV